jgi:membrane fusion protein (multidrug efflux system)
VLFEIDPRPFQASLEQAKARLAEAKAQLSKAERDLKRDTPLAEQHAIAQSQLDNDIESRNAAQASVQSAEAGQQTASLNVEFTKVTSLIDGIAAIATAQIGDLVSPSTLLTTVSQVDPIKVYFPLSESEYLHLAQPLNRPGGAQPWAGKLSLVLADGSEYPHRGTFLAADREMDSKTGTIRVSATFPNPDRTLRPGQFGRVRADTQVLDHALLVPQRAVSELQGTSLVRVVGPDNHVGTRTVVLGERVGNRWIVQSGLQPGDRVIVESPAVKDGVLVAPKPFAATGAR